MDKLNSLSYAYHYRDVDSVEYFAREAFRQSENYSGGRAEALNNLAFVNIIRMRYIDAQRQLDSIADITDNQLELLVADVQLMRLCQRRSANREFYDYYERANRAYNRINEERPLLDERQQARLRYAETELAIVNSTYYYYIGLERQSIEALHAIPADVERDTAQFLNYLYNVGAGGIITEGNQQDINQHEFDYLMRCFLLAQQGDYPYFAANALEALAEHLLVEEDRERLIGDNLPAMKYINPDGVSNDMLPVSLADNALFIFQQYGDVYQIAGAYRTLASCYRAIGDYESALFNLEQALADSIINQAPDLVASIREQLSVAYAAINDKEQSDLNRNIYLDLQEQTRQDRQLEARASQYEESSAQLNMMLSAVVLAIVLLLFLLWLFNYLSRRQKPDTHLAELLEEKNDVIAMNRLRIEDNERRNLEQRAKISLINSITPFIDRIMHEVSRLPENIAEGDEQPDNQETISRLEYIRELTDKINEYNDVLTHWIQLRQGQLNLHVESFSLQPLFDIVAKGKMSFLMKGVTLNVEPTEAQVKADRILTLFMINTLADNARKFTPEGGKVEVSATEGADFVEISVEDSGVGMDDNQLAHVFDHKISGEHGFGLLNCKGIIEKYRKVSQIFSVCELTAKSKKGQGSRFSFRLPKGVVHNAMCLLAAAFWLANSVQLFAAVAKPSSSSLRPLDLAAVYSDSAYFSNINGTYQRTLLFADSCRYYLNQHYRQLCPEGEKMMLRQGDPSLPAPEIEWFYDSLDINYNIILDIRNESAVAALALHDWQFYSYNNRIYTQLFKEMSADNTLADYCRKMQQSRINKTIAIILLILVLMAILPAYYLLYYRHRLQNRQNTELQQLNLLEQADDELRRTELENASLYVSNAVLDNCLSALKHETMYYPSRIRQLVDTGDLQHLGEVVGYYRDLYALLSIQAMRQVERVHLHLKTLDHQILGDENMVRYLFDILRRLSGEKKLAVNYELRDDRYVACKVPMPSLKLTSEQAQNLFTPATDRIEYLLCRQIVRDHGEATNRRSCGVTAEIQPDGSTVIVIVLPQKVKITTSDEKQIVFEL